MNNEENEKHLRELLQAALDGKYLQMMGTEGWFDLYNSSIFSLMPLFTKYSADTFRIKPVSHVFKYQTRLYSITGEVKVWASTYCSPEIEKSQYYDSSSFKWLAEATDHEVIINE